MMGLRLLLVVAVISSAGIGYSGSSARFVVLRQALTASQTRAAADSSAVSADGRVVAFVSRARLSATDTGDIENIYIFDRTAGLVRLETVTADGSAADGTSRGPMLSADGRYLVFASYATNLVNASDTNGASDIFLRDRSSGTTRRISIGPGGAESNGGSDSPAISDDGRVIAFASTASNLAGPVETGSVKHVYVVRPGEPYPVLINTEPDRRGSQNFAPTLSGDGNVIAFVSKTAAEGRMAIVVRDLRATLGTCITCDLIDDATGMHGFDPHLSGDGRLVAFTVAHDRGPRAISTRTDIAVHDRASSQTTVITRAANASSTRARISGNGRFVAFESLASNLACGRRCRGIARDQNLLSDIYVFDRHAGTFARVSGSREEWWVPSVGPSLDTAGNVIIFSSRQPLAADDPTTDFDLFIRTVHPRPSARR
jgi:Tol biopolymer transport system component